jgi:hypothetical protein
VAGNEDRPAMPVPDQLPRRAPVRLVRLRFQVPGPARPDAIAVVPELLPREGLSQESLITKSRPQARQMGGSLLRTKRPVAVMHADYPACRQQQSYRHSRSNWPFLAAPRNARQELPGYCTTGPSWSFESRTRIDPAVGATSTQAPLFALRLAVLHRRSPTSRLLGIIELL